MQIDSFLICKFFFYLFLKEGCHNFIPMSKRHLVLNFPIFVQLVF